MNGVTQRQGKLKWNENSQEEILGLFVGAFQIYADREMKK